MPIARPFWMSLAFTEESVLYAMIRAANWLFVWFIPVTCLFTFTCLLKLSDRLRARRLMLRVCTVHVFMLVMQETAEFN